MIVGVQAIPACFDVEQNRVSCPPEAFHIHLQTYEPLLRHPVRTNTTGHRAADPWDVQPALAQSWDVSSDGRTYSFQLRRASLSAAGNELTAHDVKWSWERAFAVNSWSARAARRCGITSPDAVRVVQPYTIQFRLDEPHPRFPKILATPLPPIYDLEAVRAHCPVGDPWGDGWLRRHTAGFGPYTLDEIVDGEEASLTANLGYWEGAPRDKRILLRALTSPEARAQALRRGNIDVAIDLSSKDLASLAAGSGVLVTSFAGSREIALRIDPAFAPFDQVRVRQALALALPYDEIARQVFGSPGARPERAEQDQRAARALLREAGYSSGFRITLYVPSDSPDLEAVARVAQRDFIRLNLKVVVEVMNRGLFAREKSSRHLPVCLEERRPMAPLLSIDELEPLPQVETLVVSTPLDYFACRSNLEGFVRRPDGHARYFELRKT